MAWTRASRATPNRFMPHRAVAGCPAITDFDPPSGSQLVVIEIAPAGTSDRYRSIDAAFELVLDQRVRWRPVQRVLRSTSFVDRAGGGRDDRLRCGP